MKSTRLAIFASGNGSTANILLSHFEKNESIQIACVLTNNPKAKVIEIAQSFSVPVVICNNEKASKSEYLIEICEINKIELVVLAGYLRKIPTDFVKYFPHKIINIHPALLPKFGGKGMYGRHVHEAVSQSEETETGISIHFVNESYDEGTLIAQFRCTIEMHEDVESIQSKIRALEKEHFAQVIEKVILT